MKYNGWTNYETWRVNLEVTSDLEDTWQEYLDDFDPDKDKAFTDLREYLAEAMKEFCMEMLETEASGIALSFAQVFVAECNFREIAKHSVAQYLEWRADKYPVDA